MASHRRPKQPSRTRVTVLTATAAAAVALTSQAANAAPTEKPSKDDQVQGRQALRGGGAGHREVQRGQGEAGEAREGDRRASGQGRARPGGPQRPARRPRFDGQRAVPHRRHRPLRPALPLVRPGQLPRQGVHLDQLSGQQAEALKKIQDKQRTLAQERAEATDKLKRPRRHAQGTGQEEEGSPGQARRGPEAAQHADRQGAGRRSPPRSSAPAATPATGWTSARTPRPRSAARPPSTPPQTQLGKPYVYGATGPGSFDCSGLTSWAYNQAGVHDTRAPRRRRQNAGTRIGRIASSSPATWCSSTATRTTSASTRATARCCTPRSRAPSVRYESMSNMALPVRRPYLMFRSAGPASDQRPAVPSERANSGTRC